MGDLYGRFVWETLVGDGVWESKFYMGDSGGRLVWEISMGRFVWETHVNAFQLTS